MSWHNPIHILAFGLGLGLSPVMPGTCGTVLGVLIYVLNVYVLHIPLWILILVGFGFGVYICDQTERDLGVPDHSGIVWDEVVGYWITLLGVPIGFYWMLYGFVVFRLFDILKPWPIRVIDQHVPGGWGIMLDDVLAGLGACLVLHLTALCWV
jgi:phosphatidylglycerophosphatase A